MSNLGLERHLDGLGLALERTQVGDRYVVEKMRADGYNLGGEQSGHIVMSDFATTGDGLLASLQVLSAMVETGRPLSELGNVFAPAPQKLINIRYDGKDPLNAAKVKTVISDVTKRLGKTGRLVIRKSGTEPLVRVMAEAEDEAMMLEAVEEVADAVRAAL
jgi:phosphoglucosamine mutase